MDVMNCQELAVPIAIMRHVVDVESAFNRYAIGVVGGRLLRQPTNLPEAIATARMLERRGFNFSVGLAQVNRYNLAKYGLSSYSKAFDTCPNLQAGARILADCYIRAGTDWGRALSCYYSGNFTVGFRDGYVRKVFASMRGSTTDGRLLSESIPIGPVSGARHGAAWPPAALTSASILDRRLATTPAVPAGPNAVAQAPSSMAMTADAQSEPVGLAASTVAHHEVGHAMTDQSDARGVVDAAFVF
jgi:type IV secretion system protein VirB1